MKKLLAILSIVAFTFATAQETQKKSCCSTAKKEKKECNMEAKKSCDTKSKSHDKKASCCSAKTEKKDKKKAA